MTRWASIDQVAGTSMAQYTPPGWRRPSTRPRPPLAHGAGLAFQAARTADPDSWTVSLLIKHEGLPLIYSRLEPNARAVRRPCSSRWSRLA